MALLFMDGFAGGDSPNKWDAASQLFTTQNASPRTAGGYYGRASSRSLYKSFTPTAKVIIGLGMRINSSSTSPYIGFYGDNGATSHIFIIRNTISGLLEIRRGSSTGGAPLAIGTNPIYVDQWNYIEVSVTISDTVGEVHVRLNGGVVDEVSYVGDTRNGGTSTDIDRVRFWTDAAQVDVTDVYLLNGAGAVNNDFLGDVVVRTLAPTGNGTYSQLVGSDGNSTDNYLLVDEVPYSSTDYVSSAAVGSKDTYQMADLPGGVTTVYGLQVNGQMSKSDASLASARYVLRSGGADYMGATRALSTTPTGYYELFEADPATGTSWTASGVNAAEAGMEVQ